MLINQGRHFLLGVRDIHMNSRDVKVRTITTEQKGEIQISSMDVGIAKGEKGEKKVKKGKKQYYNFAYWTQIFLRYIQVHFFSAAWN
jgi:hypothetical protein